MRLRRCLVKGRLEAGVDEAGRGALAGPVVAAAVVLPPGFRHQGINDSKLLTAATRYRLREVIVREAVAWEVGIVSVAEIDRINILQAALQAMHEAVDGLIQAQNCCPEHLLVDGNRFRPHPRVGHTCIIGGDAAYLAIAAASILAKTFRDDIMRQLHAHYPEYAWQTNMGYPTPTHRRTLHDLGPTPWHRRSFQVKPPQLALFNC